MLKRLTILLAAVVLVGLVACGTSQPEATPTGTKPAATQTATSAPPPTDSASGGSSSPTPTPTWQVPLVQEDDWTIGSEDAGLVIVEYSDFQCPYCAGVADLLRRLEEIYPDGLRVVFRHLPLDSIHDKAILSAEAAEAAGAQGKFWEMHDLLFARQSEWAMQSPEDALETLTAYAEELGLDGRQFSRDLEKGTYRERVVQKAAEATLLGLGSTPTLFINGQYYNGPRDEFFLGGFIKVENYDGPQYTAPPPMSIDPAQPYFARIKTNRGDFCIELYAQQAPQTVNNFVFLVQQGFYDGMLFHVVLPGVVVQTGDPTGGGFGGAGYSLPDEISPELSFDAPGVVGVFNGGANTSSSQIFITYEAMTDLDGRYPIFGRVVEGMDVVESLTPRDPQEDPYAPADNIETVTVESSCGS